MHSRQIIIPDHTQDILEIKESLRRIQNHLDQVNITPEPEWIKPAEYAAKVKRTSRTVYNWVAEGRIESRREGAVLLVRSPKL